MFADNIIDNMHALVIQNLKLVEYMILFLDELCGKFSKIDALVIYHRIVWQVEIE